MKERCDIGCGCGRNRKKATAGKTQTKKKMTINPATAARLAQRRKQILAKKRSAAKAKASKISPIKKRPQ